MTTPRLPGVRASWLMVIDLQPAFSHPDSPWFTSSVSEVAERIEPLVPLYDGRVLFTRFLPPVEIAGSWRDYYAKWDFATRAENGWLWNLDDRWKGRRSVASHTFSKWVPETIAHLGPEPEVSMCGVSTDCCVMMTALAAVDHGAHVRVIADACAAKSNDIHEGALALMRLRAPQLSLVSIARERERLAMAS
jgi:nicotinamidase-related amidase